MRTTVPVELVPPDKVVGLRPMDWTVAGLSVRFAVLEPPPVPAVMSTEAAVSTPEVETEKLTLVEPPGTVTDDGTLAYELLEDKLTVIPPEGAAELKATVPRQELPPTTEVGDRLKELTETPEGMPETAKAPADSAIWFFRGDTITWLDGRS